MKKFLAGCLIALALVTGVVATGIVPLNLSFARASIEAAASDLIGIRIDIDGDIRLRLGLTPTLAVGALGLRANSSANSLLRAEGIAASADLLDLLRGHIHLRDVTIGRGVVNYCADLPAGTGFRGDNAELPSIAINALSARAISAICAKDGEVKDGTAELEITTLRASAPAAGPLQIAADARFGERDVTLTADTGSLNDILAMPATLPLAATITAGGDGLAIRGAVLEPFEEPRLDVAFDASIADLRDWIDDLDSKIIAPVTIALEGQLQAGESRLEIPQATGSFAAAALELSASLRLDSPRPAAELDARLEHFDLGMFDNEQDGPAEQEPLPNVDFTPLFDVLQIFDGKFRLRIDRLDGAPLDIAAVDVSATLSDGRLDVQRLDFGHQQARVSASGQLDTSAACPTLATAVRIDQLTTDILYRAIGAIAIDGGVDRIEAQAESCGYSLLAHRDTLRASGRLAAGWIRWGDDGLAARIETATISTGWQAPGRIDVAGVWRGESVTGSATTGSLAALIGPELAPLNIDLDAVGATLTFDGRTNPRRDDLRLIGAIAMSAPRLGSTSAWTDIRGDAEAGASLSAAIRVDGSAFIVDEILATIGRSDMAGRLTLEDTGDGMLGKLRLRSRTQDLTEISELIEIDATEPAAGDRGSNQVLRLLELQLPRVDVDVAIERLHFQEFDITDVTVRGRMRDALINDARVAMLFEGVDLTGTLDLDIRSSMPTGSLTVGASDIDVGRLLAAVDLIDGLQARADSVNIEVASRGATFRSFATNSTLRADVRGFHWARQDVINARLREINLDEFSLTTAPDAPSIWRSEGLLNGVPSRMLVTSPSLPDMFARDSDLPLKLALLSADQALLVEAKLRRDGLRLTGADISASGATVDTQSVDMASLESPLNEYQAVARISLDDDFLTVTDLIGRIGASHAEGNARIGLTGDQRLILIELVAPHVQTDDFVAISAIWQDMHDDEDAPARGAQDSGDDERKLLDVVVAAIEELTSRNTFDIDVEIEDLRAGTDRLGTAEMRLIADDDELHLSPFRISLPGGVVDAEYHIEKGAAGYDVDLRLHAESLAYGGLMRLLEPGSDAAGLAYADARLTSFAPNLDSIPQNYQGHVDLIAAPVDVEAGVLGLWAANVVLAILPTPQDSEPKKVNCLVTRFEVEDGVMKTKNVMLDTTDVIVRGRGKIDLANRNLDLIFAPQAKREKFLSMSTPVTITGPWDDFQLSVNPGGLVVTAFRWYMSLIYVPFKWLTGERFPSDGLATCFKAMNWELTPELAIGIHEKLGQMRYRADQAITPQ